MYIYIYLAGLLHHKCRRARMSRGGSGGAGRLRGPGDLNRRPLAAPWAVRSNDSACISPVTCRYCTVLRRTVTDAREHLNITYIHAVRHMHTYTHAYTQMYTYVCMDSALSTLMRAHAHTMAWFRCCVWAMLRGLRGSGCPCATGAHTQRGVTQCARGVYTPSASTACMCVRAVSAPSVSSTASLPDSQA